MKKITSVVIASCLFSFFALFPFAGPFVKEATAKAKTIKIGLITSVTGPMAPAFKPMFDAAQPTADLVNQRGGITVNGQQYLIEIIVEDDQSSPPGAVSAANKLMQDGVKFMIAPMFMVSNMAIAPTTEQAKILRMKAMGMGPEEVGPNLRYSFFTSASIYNTPYCFEYLVKTYPKVKKIAVIPPDDPGAKSAIDFNRKHAEKHGLKVVFSEAFKIPTEDFYPILTKALEKKPDAINCVVSIVPWAAGLINQSRELGFTGPIFAPCLFGDINLVNSMIDKKYAYDIFHGGPDVLSPKMIPIVQDLRKLVEKKTNIPLIMDNVLVLDGLWPILQGIEKAQSFDTDKVVDTLEGMTSIETVWGKGRWGGQDLFGINHVIIRPITFSRIVNGNVEFEFVKF
jgi:branched-chain amino acid transport system substrate-binding protein